MIVLWINWGLRKELIGANYMMIGVIKLAGDINLKIVNYKWDSSKKQVNKKADHLSADRIQSLFQVRLQHCEFQRLNIVPKVHHIQSKLQIDRWE